MRRERDAAVARVRELEHELGSLRGRVKRWTDDVAPHSPPESPDLAYADRIRRFLPAWNLGGDTVLDLHSGARSSAAAVGGVHLLGARPGASPTGSGASSTTHPPTAPSDRRLADARRRPTTVSWCRGGTRAVASSPPPTTRWRWPPASSSCCSITTISSPPTLSPRSTARSAPIDGDRLRLQRRGQDRRRRFGVRHLLQAGLVAGAAARPELLHAPVRVAPHRGGGRRPVPRRLRREPGPRPDPARQRAGTRRIHHVAAVLYHWCVNPGSAAADPHAKPYAREAGRRAVG